eukprot:1160799-Pelagomonas_calceolata.AAC.3
MAAVTSFSFSPCMCLTSGARNQGSFAERAICPCGNEWDTAKLSSEGLREWGGIQKNIFADVRDDHLLVR